MYTSPSFFFFYCLDSFKCLLQPRSCFPYLFFKLLISVITDHPIETTTSSASTAGHWARRPLLQEHRWLFLSTATFHGRVITSPSTPNYVEKAVAQQPDCHLLGAPTTHRSFLAGNWVQPLLSLRYITTTVCSPGALACVNLNQEGSAFARHWIIS